jgi:hypothetical protein
VFSPSLFPLFKGGDPRRNVTGPYGPTTALGSPAVVAALQQLSGCATALGVPLEDEGSSGSKGSHWWVGRSGVAGGAAGCSCMPCGAVVLGATQQRWHWRLHLLAAKYGIVCG